MNGEGAAPPEASSERRARKPRPEIQIYRPGMLRKGDSTKSLTTNDERPPRPEKLTTTSSEVTSRRRSNDADSVTSRGDSGSTTPDANVMNEKSRRRFAPTNQSQHDRRPAEGSNYNSTQSLYDTRRQGGYTEYNGNRSNRGGGGGGGGGRFHQQNQYRQPFERAPNSRGFNERASMRGDGAIARRPNTGGRRRNDSINSTQSEMPASSNDHHQLHIDTTYESASQCGASSAFSMNSLGEAFSFEEMCQNLQSFASMDWSKEVENEFAMQQEMEEEARQRKNEVVEEVETISPKKGRAGNGRLQESNGQSNPPSSRRSKNRRNHRHDESDRESSFGGSIAEEEEDEGEEEMKSGERTPTSSRNSIQPYNPRTMYQKHQKQTTNNENNGYSRRPNYNHGQTSETTAPEKKERRGGYRGEHDDRDDGQYGGIEQHMSSGRLAGRISIVRREVPAEERSRAQKQAEEITKIIQKRSKSPDMTSREALNRRRKEEIEKNEGPRIEALNEKAMKLTSAVRKRDVKAAEKLVKISRELAELHSQTILPDVTYSFTNGLEQKMFRKSFYKPIEAMRSGANSTAIEAKLVRAQMNRLLMDGIACYEQLIRDYETRFNLTLSDALTWPSGAPTDTQFTTETVRLPCGSRKFESSTQKIALKSLSRHLTNLGDLHRYKTLIDGSENYDVSKGFYLKAALLWSSTGHPYNQLGVVVYYSDRVIDELFYLTRALACTHPYEPAKDRLTQRLDAMRKKVMKYQPLLDKETGTVRADAAKASKLRGILQLFIHPTTNEVTSSSGEKIVDDVLSDLIKQPKDRLHRRAVSYLSDTFGLLVTKIGMEHFGSVSERAFALLYASLVKPDTVFGAQQLAKFAAMMIYAVEVNGKKDTTSPETNDQLRTAVDTMFTYYAVLIQILLSENLTGEKPSPRVLLLLPAINVISTWLCHSDTQLLLGSSISTLPSTILPFDGSSVTERVKMMKVEKELVESEDVTYPEYVLLASFFTAFKPQPIRSRQASRGGSLTNGRLLMMCEAVKTIGDRVETAKSCSSDEQKQTEETDESPRNRRQILEEEREKRTRAFVVKPEYLVPDTNVFIGELTLIQELFATEKFHILVPIRVKEELLALSRTKTPPTETSGDPERTSKAKIAYAWLQKEFQQKNDRMSALSSQGSRISGLGSENSAGTEEKLNNDDVILQSALKYTATFEPSGAIFARVTESLLGDYKPENIYKKTCVLLTGDRGLTIKSMDSNLPCRNIRDFAEWLGLSN